MSSYALAAPYAAKILTPWSAPIEDTSTMPPRPRLTIAAANRLVNTVGVTQLTVMFVSSSSVGVVRNRPWGSAAAL